MRLKLRLAAWCIVAILAAFMLSLVVFWGIDYQHRQTRLQNQLQRATESADNHLTHRFNQLLSDIIYLQRSSVGRAADNSLPEAVRAQWLQYLREHPYLQQIQLRSATGGVGLVLESDSAAPISLPDETGLFFSALNLPPDHIGFSDLVFGRLEDGTQIPVFYLLLHTAADGMLANNDVLLLRVNGNFLFSAFTEFSDQSYELMLTDARGRVLVDSRGVPYWQAGDSAPTALITPPAEIDRSTLQVDGSLYTHWHNVVLPLSRLNSSVDGIVEPATPWRILARERLSVLPRDHSFWQTSWLALLVVVLAWLGYRILRRGIHLEAALVSNRRLIQRLQQHSDEMSAIVRQLGESVLLFDDSQNLIRANDNARTLLNERFLCAAGDHGCQAQDLLPEICHFGHLQTGISEFLLEKEVAQTVFARVTVLLHAGAPHYLVLLTLQDESCSLEPRVTILAKAMDACDEMIALLGSDLRILYINRQAARLLGIDLLIPETFNLRDFDLQLEIDLASRLGDLAVDGASLYAEGMLYSAEQVYQIALNIRRLSDGPDGVTYLMRITDVTAGQDTEKLRAGEQEEPLWRALPSRVQLGRLFEELVEDGRPLALVLLDIDRLQSINDRFGYRAGDQVIDEFSRRLLREVPDQRVARLNADCFVAFIHGGEEEVYQLLSQLRQVMSTRPLNLQGHPVVMTFSAGIAYWPRHAQNFDTLLQAGLLALNHVHGRRGEVRVYDPRSRGENEGTVPVPDSWLRRAVEEGRFELFFQPIVNIHKGRIVAFEALIHLRDERGRLMESDQFMPALELSGWILLLEGWLLRSTMLAAATLGRGMPGGCCVALNLTCDQLQAPGFMEHFTQLMKETACNPRHLIIEISESQLTPHYDELANVLKSLRELGVNLAIDDFGSGYSSLAYIKELPVNDFKLAQTFVAGLPHSRPDQVIISSIGRMVEGLGAQFIAQGVSTREQMFWLQHHHVDLQQGSLFARPAPLEVWLGQGAIDMVLRTMPAQANLSAADMDG